MIKTDLVPLLPIPALTFIEPYAILYYVAGFLSACFMNYIIKWYAKKRIRCY